MRELLRDRRTFAAALVLLVAVCAVVGALRDDEGRSDESGAAAIPVAPSGSSAEGGPPSDSPSGPAYPTAVAPSHPPVDQVSGLPVVRLAELPPEATETVALIRAGGPFPYADDGETFLNSAGLLPERKPGYYRVYTVEAPGSADPTERRIVSGTDGELYWTDDLYASFRRIEA